MANFARFTVNLSPSSAGGYDAVAGQVLSFQAEGFVAGVVQRMTYQVYDANETNPPLASLNAPTLTLAGASSGQKVDAATPGAAVTTTLPSPLADGASWRVRALANGGIDSTGRPNPDYVFERLIVVRSSAGLRKEVDGEGTSYSPRGRADAQNEIVAAVRSATKVRAHTATFSPIALYQFDGDLTDQTGTVGTLVTHGTGGPFYGEVAPGLRGLHLDGLYAVKRNAVVSAVNLVGEMTLEMILAIYATPTSGNVHTLVDCGESGETSNDNRLYVLRYDFLTFGPRSVTLFWENAEGFNIFEQTPYNLPLGRPFHLAYARVSAGGGAFRNRIYVNGNLVHESSSTYAGPSFGVSPIQKLFIGAGSEPVISAPFIGGIASLKIHNVALTGAQIASDAAGCGLLAA